MGFTKSPAGVPWNYGINGLVLGTVENEPANVSFPDRAFTFSSSSRSIFAGRNGRNAYGGGGGSEPGGALGGS